jgi:hypothetical protein
MASRTRKTDHAATGSQLELQFELERVRFHLAHRLLVARALLRGWVPYIEQCIWSEKSLPGMKSIEREMEAMITIARDRALPKQE